MNKRIEKRVMRHAIASKPLSELRLPFQTVIRTLCECGVGAVESTGAYVLSFDPLLCVAWGVKGGPDAVRLLPDDEHGSWLLRSRVGIDPGGDIGEVWRRIERDAIEQQRLEMGCWQD